MTAVSTHAPGSFCWVELATTNQSGAVSFYRSLFGWEVSDLPLGPDDTYSLFRVNGRDVAAAFTMRPEERQAGAHARWNLYVAVARLEDAVATAESLGADTVVPAFDVNDAGRMAILKDPSGAEFRLWQANKHLGVGLLNEPGALCWSELTTRDVAAAERFYTALFSWTAKHSTAGAPMEYVELSHLGQPSMGMLPMPPQVPASVPSYWMPYFQVTDFEQSAKRAHELGATAVVGPHDLEHDMGRFVIEKDPDGALFGVFGTKAAPSR